MTTKIFISQPMNGLGAEEIKETRNKAIQKAKELFVDIEVLETYFTDFSTDKKPLHYLAKSLEMLADADVAIFCGKWAQARGCRIEQICATEYGVERVFLPR